jgi:hypothetical protein
MCGCWRFPGHRELSGLPRRQPAWSSPWPARQTLSQSRNMVSMLGGCRKVRHTDTDPDTSGEAPTLLSIPRQLECMIASRGGTRAASSRKLAGPRRPAGRGIRVGPSLTRSAAAPGSLRALARDRRNPRSQPVPCLTGSRLLIDSKIEKGLKFERFRQSTRARGMWPAGLQSYGIRSAESASTRLFARRPGGVRRAVRNFDRDLRAELLAPKEDSNRSPRRCDPFEDGLRTPGVSIERSAAQPLQDHRASPGKPRGQSTRRGRDERV